MEEAKEETDASLKRLLPKMKYCKFIFILLLALAIAYLHAVYVAHLFESNLHFSHLSRLEREMALRTEMGFYYSYYKTVVEERPYLAAITKLMYDRTVEYPKEVNAFNRFNIHPEVLIGSLYRYLEPWLESHRACRTVLRGDLPPVESCVGLGEPVFFYLQAVWTLAGFTAAAVFVCGTVLSNTILGGLFALAQYMSNHGNCTRVMWTPNERETFAQPLLLVQFALLTMQLRGRGALALQVAIFLLNSLCLLFWQFTQFIFLTQTAIFFVMEQLRLIDIKFLWLFLHSHFCGLHMAVLLLQGNDMLKSSLYASFFIVVSAYCLFFSSFRIKVQSRLDLFVESWLVVLRIAIVICCSVWLKNVIADFLNVDEDGHIWEILYSKFTNYKSFHTLIYTCSEVFDYMPLETWRTLFVSSLIPVTLLAIFNALYFWYRSTKDRLRLAESGKKDKSKESNAESDDDSGIENSEAKNDEEKNKMAADVDVLKGGKLEKEARKEKDWLIEFLKNMQVDPGVFYNVSQMVVFGVMAALVMRLKLLFVPHMCLVSSLVMDTKQFPQSVRWYSRTAVLPLLLLCAAVGIALTVREETSHVGEFSDPLTEEFLSWLASETRASAVLAGPAPLMATVLLSTRRAVVTHPHYEHRDVRDRTYAVYKSYGRFSPTELHQELSKFKVTHLVVDNTYCYWKSRRGCTFIDIWDATTPALSTRPRLCDVLRSGVAHFYRVYHNERYTVYHVHDYSVRYSPRALDT